MFQNVLGGLESVLCTNGILAWIFLENHEVHFRVPVGSIEGPGRILDPIRITSRLPRVPWYGLCSLKGKNDDSVKEAPAYCRSFLDGLYKANGVGEGQIPFFDVLLCFVGFCKVL